MPVEEIPSHSDSEISGGSPPDRTCSNSETSSGVHSNSSRDSEHISHQPTYHLQPLHHQQLPPHKMLDLHTNSVPPLLFVDSPQKIHPQQWIQRNAIHSPPPYTNNRVYKPQQHYAVASKTPVINEVAEEPTGTVVIRRKSSLGGSGLLVKSPLSPDSPSDRFSRSTNMRMTSFSDQQQQLQTAAHGKLSATLPHYPTSQPVGLQYPHCSTMPLPLTNAGCQLLTNGSSCSSFPRPHATIPTHHNGISLCNGGGSSSSLNSTGIYSPKYPLPVHHGYQPAAHEASSTPVGCTLKTSHHTFPQLPSMAAAAKYCLQRNGGERDSANFSMGSSGDSDVCNGSAVAS